MEKINPHEKIVGLNIPDSDLNGWLQELQQSKLTSEEIDAFLAHLNKNYASKLLTKAAKVESELKGSVAYLEEKFGHPITPEAELYLRKAIDKMFSNHAIDITNEFKLEDGNYDHKQG